MSLGQSEPDLSRLYFRDGSSVTMELLRDMPWEQIASMMNMDYAEFYEIAKRYAEGNGFVYGISIPEAP